MKTVKETLANIDRFLSVSAISREYFGKERSWFNNKLSERPIKGVKCHFSLEECLILSDALADLASKISEAATELRGMVRHIDKATGRFFTKTNPFNHPLFYEWLSLLPSDAVVIEPFAGACDIPKLLGDVGFCPSWKCYDINPPAAGNGFHVTKRNSLDRFPKGSIFITNPPFLAKNSAKKSHYPFPKTIYPNLYLHCLGLMLEHGKYIAAILPESFISCKFLKERLFGIISINYKVFETTDYPVCLALFVPENREDYPIYSGNDFLGTYRELSCYNYADTEQGDWTFNNPLGNIGIKCVDGLTESICFMRGETIQSAKIKVSSRSLTRVEGLPSNIDRDSFIECCNSLLKEYRNKTKDIFMTSFKGLRKDNHYRRRIDFGTLRNIMNTALVMMNTGKSKIILGQEEIYKASPRIWSFKYADDIVNGINLRLSNMLGGYPFKFEGYQWPDSERLYLCGEFSTDTEQDILIQRKLMAAKSGYAAKRFVKTPNKRFVRKDFEEFRLQWMLYVVWQKCQGSIEFQELLMKIPKDVVLVENTTTDKQGTADVWGCKNKELVNCRKALEQEIKEKNPNMKKKDLEHLVNVETNKIDHVGEWRGQNNIGKILMICRDCLREKAEPPIDYDLLRRSNIYLFGKILTFENRE